jgi:hypothetical protein
MMQAMNMKQLAATLCIWVFVFGFLIVPALHTPEPTCGHDGCQVAHAHQDQDQQQSDDRSDSGEESDDSGSCPICKLAATPTIASCGAIQVEALIPTVQPLQLATITASSRLASGSFQARAPPCLPSV